MKNTEVLLRLSAWVEWACEVAALAEFTQLTGGDGFVKKEGRPSKSIVIIWGESPGHLQQ